MKFKCLMMALAGLTLTACVDAQNATTGPDEGFIEVSDAVVAAVSPSQDLRFVRIDPIDGCYVYRHTGPVETTFLPLRTKNGNPICSRPKEDVAS